LHRGKFERTFSLMLSKFVGSLIGLAVGDSLGARREGLPPGDAEGEISRYTDDTAMAIGVAESLIECRGLDPEHMARRFVENYRREPWRGYGPGPPMIFEMIRRGGRWDEALDRKLYPGGSFGNGSAMRVAPIGLFYFDDPEGLRDAAYMSSVITHSHPLALEGAALEAYAVALALRDEERFLEELIGFARSEVYRRKLELVGELLPGRGDRRKVVERLGNGVEAFNSVPTAIYCFLSSSSFEDSLTYAVSLGGDADTIGAMCGAIAGARWGVEAIPGRWRERLENRSYIEGLAKGLWNLARSRDL